MEKKMKLSVQAVGSIMLSLQKCLAEMIDITDILLGLELVETEEGLVILNPPVIRVLVSKESDGPCCGGEGCKCGKSAE